MLLIRVFHMYGIGIDDTVSYAVFRIVFFYNAVKLESLSEICCKIGISFFYLAKNKTCHSASLLLNRISSLICHFLSLTDALKGIL